MRKQRSREDPSLRSNLQASPRVNPFQGKCVNYEPAVDFNSPGSGVLLSPFMFHHTSMYGEFCTVLVQANDRLCEPARAMCCHVQKTIFHSSSPFQVLSLTTFLPSPPKCLEGSTM